MALKFFAPARLAALAASLFFGAPALAADYQTDLSPMPLDDETKFIIDGRGNATASYDGKTFTVKGDFKGMPSNAISAHIFSSHLPGMPGPKQFDLEVTKSTSGTISGSFTLTPTQQRLLRTGKLYIQINSEKAPEEYPWGPKGTLWGWLFPAYEVVGPNVPQQNHWFIPQLDVPTR